MAIIQGNAKQGSTRGFYPKGINGSLRFNDDDSAYLSLTPTGTSGGRTKFTYSGWVKICEFSTANGFHLIHAPCPTANNLNGSLLYINSSNVFRAQLRTYNTGAQGAVDASYTSSMVFRDPSAWYHIVFAFDSTATLNSDDTMRLWVNGVLQTNASPDYPSASGIQYLGSEVTHEIGRWLGSSHANTNGYMADVHFIDGQALTADDFGETKNGVWVAKDYAGTYGTNGFHLEFNAQLPSFTADYLVVGGGGGGGRGGGGGGAGGFREFTGETLYKGYAYPLTIGTGGAGSSDYSLDASNGGDSIFVITAAGGGGGGSHLSGTAASGGSGGGGGSSGSVNAGGSGNTPSTSPSQGNNGGTSSSSALAYGAGGGGGAGSAGQTGSGTYGGDGGSGAVSTIDGNTYAGGGGGAGQTGINDGTGGSGIGGDAGNTGNGGDAVASTGSGGGGTGFNAGGNQGGSGSDGIILIKIPDTVTATFSAGVTQSSSTAGGYVTYTVTATSGSETVEFS